MQSIRTAVPAAANTIRQPPDYAAARRWLWRALILTVVGAWAGITWDQIWHATEPFDGFWSPPHLVVYATVTLVAFMIMGLLFDSRLRRAFGRGFDVVILPFKVPGALFILGMAILLLGFAGAVLDNIWHTAFGLNETAWSFPHAMIGWSLNLLAMGFLACRLAMAHIKPMPWTTTALLGSLIASMLIGSLLGPFSNNRTPESVDFFFTYIPALATQESSQSLYRIFQTWNINRTNPIVLLLAPFALGVALGWLRKLDARWWMTLLIMCMVLAMDGGNRDLGDWLSQFIPEFAREANWRALPVVLPTMLLLLLVRLRVNEGIAYGLAGILFALMIYGIWHGTGAVWLLSLFAAPLILFGKRLGERLNLILTHPHSLGVVMPLIACVVIFPLITGVVDLALRLGTP